MIVAILAVCAGYAIIFGAKGLAERLLRAVVGLAIILSVLPGLLDHAMRLGSGRGSPPTSAHDRHIVWWVAAGAALAVFGYVAWRLRPVLARRRDALRRRHGSPRERLRPPPPPMDASA